MSASCTGVAGNHPGPIVRIALPPAIESTVGLLYLRISHLPLRVNPQFDARCGPFIGSDGVVAGSRALILCRLMTGSSATAI